MIIVALFVRLHLVPVPRVILVIRTATTVVANLMASVKLPMNAEALQDLIIAAMLVIQLQRATVLLGRLVIRICNALARVRVQGIIAGVVQEEKIAGVVQEEKIAVVLPGLARV